MRSHWLLTHMQISLRCKLQWLTLHVGASQATILYIWAPLLRFVHLVVKHRCLYTFMPCRLVQSAAHVNQLIGAIGKMWTWRQRVREKFRKPKNIIYRAFTCFVSSAAVASASAGG